MRYKVDLKAYMACCESNYHHLLRLFPGIEQHSQRRIGIDALHRGEVNLLVLERTPYTTLLSISSTSTSDERYSQHSPSRERDNSITVHWQRAPHLVVRLYHDARMAEVVSCESSRGVRPKNIYPNKNMFQPDEKQQWNTFLRDWLAQCQQHGYALSDQHSISGITCQ